MIFPPDPRVQMKCTLLKLKKDNIDRMVENGYLGPMVAPGVKRACEERVAEGVEESINQLPSSNTDY